MRPPLTSAKGGKDFAKNSSVSIVFHIFPRPHCLIIIRQEGSLGATMLLIVNPLKFVQNDWRKFLWQEALHVGLATVVFIVMVVHTFSELVCEH